MSESDSSSHSLYMKQASNNLAINNPYELIKKMNSVIAQQKKQIKEYEMALTSISNEKELLVNEKRKIQESYSQVLAKFEEFVNDNGRLQHDRSLSQQLNMTDISTYRSQLSTKKVGHSGLISPKLRTEVSKIPISVSSVKMDYKFTSITKKKITFPTEDEYIPEPIILDKSSDISLLDESSSKNEGHTHKCAQTLIEDFLIIGPQTNQFKNQRNINKNTKIDQIVVSPCVLYNYNKFFTLNKTQPFTEIANRAFPHSCVLKQKTMENHQSLWKIVQHLPNNKLSRDYFVFTIVGDGSLLNRKNKGLFENCNPNNYLYVVCVKLPEIINVRDEKNYHRKQNEVWVTDKVYAIATYYPFFDVMVQILFRMQEILSKNAIRKIIIENESPLFWGLSENVYSFQQNKDIKQIIQYFFQKKPEISQIYHLNKQYFGYIPTDPFQVSYSVALSTCPILFSSICYQQMLLLLTAIFLEKSLIFISSEQSISSLCSLFFTNLISPFAFDLIHLNIDSNRIDQLIFQYPFPITSSLKKTDRNLETILSFFAASNVDRATKNDARYVMIDVDSNTILYHQVLEEKFANCLLNPGEQIKELYLQINDCQPKSLTTVKALHRQMLGTREKPRTQKQKKQQQKKKYTKEYKQKIHNNKTKMPTYQLSQKHELLLKKLIEYIQTFTIDEEYFREQLNLMKNKHRRLQIAKRHLLEKPEHRSKGQFIDNLVRTQIYANYLDSKIQEISSNK